MSEPVSQSVHIPSYAWFIIYLFIMYHVIYCTLLVTRTLCVSVSVGGVLSLGTYTVLFLKLYSYMDSNKWCREIRQAKAKRMTRSYSCKYINIGTAEPLNHCD